MDLGLAEDAVLLEELDVLGLDQRGKGIRRGLKVGQATSSCLGLPLLGVAVAVEEDALVIAEGVAHEAHGDGGEVLVGTIGNVVHEALALLCDSGVEDDVGVREVLLAAAHTELELVAGEGERGSAVAVGVVAQDLGQLRDAQIDGLTIVGLGLLLLHERLNDRREGVAQEDGDDRRGRLVGAEAVVVTGRGHGHA